MHPCRAQKKTRPFCAMRQQILIVVIDWKSYSRISGVFFSDSALSKFTGTFPPGRESDNSGSATGEIARQIVSRSSNEVARTLRMGQVVTESPQLQEDYDMHARTAQHHPGLRRQEEIA